MVAVVVRSCLTSGYPEDPHHPHDGWVDGDRTVSLYLLQQDPDQRQNHYENVQLIPPVLTAEQHNSCCKLTSTLFII